MFYQLYELNHASLQPARAYADAVRLFYSNPLNPFSHTQMGPLGCGDGRAVRAHDAALRQAALRHIEHDGRLEERGGDRARSSGSGRSAT